MMIILKSKTPYEKIVWKFSYEVPLRSCDLLSIFKEKFWKKYEDIFYNNISENNLFKKINLAKPYKENGDNFPWNLRIEHKTKKH